MECSMCRKRVGKVSARHCATCRNTFQDFGRCVKCDSRPIDLATAPARNCHRCWSYNTKDNEARKRLRREKRGPQHGKRQPRNRGHCPTEHLLAQSILRDIVNFRENNKAFVQNTLGSWNTEVGNFCSALFNDDIDLIPNIVEDPESLDSMTKHGDDRRLTTWLSTNAKDFKKYLQNNGNIPSHISTIRISGTLTQHEIDGAVAEFLNFFASSNYEKFTVERQNWHRTGNKTKTMLLTMPEFLNRFSKRLTDPISRTIQDFYNFLSISGAATQCVPVPKCIQDLGCTLLDTLTKELHAQLRSLQGDKSRGKDTNKAPLRNIDMESCFRFTIASEKYSFSGWHLDVLNGTWLTVLTGWRAWFIYTGPWTEKEKADFARDGPQWKPPPDSIKLIILGPGDTLVMLPGHPVIHAVLTLEDSIASGGAIWANDAIPMIMENMQYIIPHTQSTNEDIPQQLPEYLNVLQDLVNKTQLDIPENLLHLMKRKTYSHEIKHSVNNAIAVLKESKLLSCDCRGKCNQARSKAGPKSKFCPCRVSGLRVGGCTEWCHGRVPLLRACY